MTDVLTSLPVDFLFTMHATLAKAVVIPDGPLGTRVLVSVTGGSVSGPRISGELLAAGGDWVTMQSNGLGRLDVRVIIRTDDGAMIDVEYTGLLGSDRVARVAPRFQTGDERYSWLNEIQAIALGALGPDEVTYQVYALS